MKLSVIFPTYNRPKDLKIALDSLLEQKLLPFETIVVDQSDNDLTKKLCSEKKYDKIWMKYIYSDCKSAAKAKEIWMDSINDKVWWFLFFDDDVKLMPNFLDEVSKFLESTPEALWGWWKILNYPIKKSLFQDLWHLFFRNKFISWCYWTLDAQYKHPDKIQNVTDMIWCDVFFRRDVKDKWYRFVDWIKWSGHAEETFFQYQIYKDYPNSLFYLPTAEVYHYEVPTYKWPRFQQVFFHRYVFWKKYNFAMRKYYWRTFGYFMLQFIKSKNKSELLKLYIKTMKQIRLHKKEIIEDPNIIRELIG